MTFPQLLRRGVAAGAIAGALAAVYLLLLVEPLIEKALVIEEAREHGHSHGHEEELVSRLGQVLGAIGTLAVVGIIFGIVLAVVFAASRDRLPVVHDHGRSALLAGIGFVVFALLPAIKLPANPPGVGDPDSVDQRTVIYLALIVLGIALAVAALSLDRTLAGHGLTGPVRSTLLIGGSVLVAAVVLVLLPASQDAVADDIPAALLWEFRLASLGQLAVLWAALGLTFGVLVSRLPAARDAELVAR
ncbi:CbtA family protein [Nocardioides limicola]|uniref:CbtA family protein n=1 Tax=Nocardioides limicola TaxID=2803368 RepID=UPI00193C5BC6|nr:CbtA family protein [Nocardioides sp. DJM-14]